jgi:methyltransferase family protein
MSFPGLTTGTRSEAVPLLAGPRHEEILSALHAHLKPRTYLEIGVEHGETLRLARCPSIGIDPNMQIDHQAIGEKPACLLYRMGSDRFFETYDPEALLGDRIDFAFLDGMHLFEFLLRDFINVERHCRRNSLIVLHDYVPTDLYLARRHREDEALRGTTRIVGGWCGDVWKMVLILREYRPDLRIYGFDAALTGMVIVTKLPIGMSKRSKRSGRSIWGSMACSATSTGANRPGRTCAILLAVTWRRARTAQRSIGQRRRVSDPRPHFPPPLEHLGRAGGAISTGRQPRNPRRSKGD